MNICGQVAEGSGPHWRTHPSDEWIKAENGVIHFSAKALSIIWGHDRRFWQWIPLSKEESVFEIGAELLQVNWIEVTGKLDFSQKHGDVEHGEYGIFYRVKFKVDAFGWHAVPITFKVTHPDGKETKKTEMLEHYRKKGEMWHEIQGGQFTVPSDKNGTIEFGMYEVESDWWKGSLVLEGVIIRPLMAA
eukprot:TRINITY_DN22832_c0_g1_i1.p1 TRINITY_DN22832_c0_g1~~TRINITY_DN22832_c0_g1_i1.p1  ORF type:complete len:189 (-),score=31.84 TRINITY_DN22832_c0_g1_i1:194-760(-)